MYRLVKVLNHNTVIVEEEKKEYLIMGKGIGFGKKAGYIIEAQSDHTIYSLTEAKDQNAASELANSINPLFLEIADEILKEAKKTFDQIDMNVLFPMADHIEYAVKRIQNGEQISNPLTDDIRILFHEEYKVAECIRRILKERLQIMIDPDEVGYVALHIHSAIQDEKVSQAMQIARAVRECIALVEEETRINIDIASLSYNRLMNHVRNMVARALTGERLKLNMNDYMEVKFPWAFQTAKTICDQVARSLRCELGPAEIGYLAMHIERVVSDELES